MLLGYARVSRSDQKLESQTDALEDYGCEKIFTDKMSGVKKERPGCDRMLKFARPKDTIVVWKLDRLGRNVKHLISLVEELNDREIGLVSLNDPIDTTSAQGRLVFNIFICLAEFERDIIRERTLAGLAAARARGRKGGRRPGLTDSAKMKARMAESLYNDGVSVSQICTQLKMSRSTLYRYLRHRNVPLLKPSAFGTATPNQK